MSNSGDDMFGFAKTIVVAILVTCTAGAVLVWAWVSHGAEESYEGYFAPVYSPDGQYVYFVERRTTGNAKGTEQPDLFLGSTKYDVFVAKDTFTLNRLSVQSGKVEELVRFSPSPIEGKRYQVIASAFQNPRARLRFSKDGQLEFDVCLSVQQQPRDKEYLSSGVWNESRHAAQMSQSWKEAYCQMSGYDEWPIFGDWELMEAPRGEYYFHPAILAYNHVTNDVKVLIKNEKYDRRYPQGVPVAELARMSRRAIMERDQAMRRTHEELVQKYKGMGMGEAQALLRTGKDMQQLGYYPKTPTIVARRMGQEEIANVDKDALFNVPKGEMDSGVLHDIELAIASPGEEIDKDTDGYYIHRDYSNSARLNAFLRTGKSQFYVRYLGQTYELTIKKPEPRQ